MKKLELLSPASLSLMLASKASAKPKGAYLRHQALLADIRKDLKVCLAQMFQLILLYSEMKKGQYLKTFHLYKCLDK